MKDQEILLEVLRRFKEDPWCRECLEQIRQYEDAFHTIRSKLTEEEQEQLDLYIGACEAWCESHMFVAYHLGRDRIFRGLYYWEARSMLLSCPAKKVTKECGQRGAEAGCSRTRAAPFGIPRRALGIRWSTLTGKTCFLVAALLIADCSTTSALPIFTNLTLRAKNRDIFCPNRIEVKVLQSLRKCVPGDS